MAATTTPSAPGADASSQRNAVGPTLPADTIRKMQSFTLESPTPTFAMPLRQLTSMIIEPAVFLYMFTSFVHIAVFQSLLYEKSGATLAASFVARNVSEIEKKVETQALANHTFLLSSLCLLLPSMFVTVICGSLSDLRHKKKTLILPFIGLLIADVNYIAQSCFDHLSIYLLLIADVCFGLFGGYTAILGGIFSYSARSVDRNTNSCRIASMEGFIGFGGTLGLSLSGVLRNYLPYWAIFSMNGVIHLIILIYLLIVTRKTKDSETAIEGGEKLSRGRRILFHFHQLLRVLFKRRNDNGRKRIILGMVAFCFSYFLSSGAQYIMFFYFKFRYDWSLSEYGIFRGTYYGISSLLVITLYPYLKAKGASDLDMAMMGLINRLISSLILSLAPTGVVALFALLFLIFNRFNATGLRSMLSAQVAVDEQGKMFAAVAILESSTGLASSLIFNSVFPVTLTLFQGFCYALIAALFVVPIGCVLYTMRSLRRRRA